MIAESEMRSKARSEKLDEEFDKMKAMSRKLEEKIAGANARLEELVLVTASMCPRNNDFDHDADDTLEFPAESSPKYVDNVLPSELPETTGQLMFAFAP